ncbi:hypothetical protein PENTCL1PPCAC_22204, partial [Pristionchus entomophagus]
ATTALHIRLCRLLIHSLRTLIGRSACRCRRSVSCRHHVSWTESLIGGCYRQRVWNDGEYYDTQKDIWTMIASMKKGMIYLVGG